MKLPSLPLPQISGHYEDWSFEDQSVYNPLNSYTSIERSQYIKQSCTPRDPKNLLELEEGPQSHSLPEGENPCEISPTKNTQRDSQNERDNATTLQSPSDSRILGLDDAHAASLRRSKSAEHSLAIQFNAIKIRHL